MRTRIRRLVALSLMALVAAAALAPTPAAAAIGRPERVLARLVNEFRNSLGRDRLQVSESLSRTAERNSARMARTGQITHSADIPCGGWNAEVAGMGSSVRDAVRRLKNSSLHRELMLRPQAERMGVGVRNGVNGLVYVTVDLCS